jgi:hypothetical protein
MPPGAPSVWGGLVRPHVPARVHHVSHDLKPQASHTLGVMRGLDPRTHEATQRLRPYGCYLPRSIMDCRVKPGNDTRRG